ncbi:YbaB/EbfC family nucleoid-associated protein [Daejeonella sp.]|uniref:YbaB/EbfC family nucleoid-associated protein n=1 Tax=Daejeonella sp. TaxID=2805397 RepID=UPI0037C0FAFE
MSSKANKRITSVSIAPQFLASSDAEELEDLLLTAINKVLYYADNVHHTEI